jgi:hypothetical protein
MTIEETCDQMRRERDAARSQLAALRSAVDAAVARAESAEADLAVKTHALRQACLAAQTERDALAKTLAEARLAMKRALAEREMILEQAQRAAAGPWHYASIDLRLDAEADVRREAALLLWFRARAAEILGER